MASHKEEIAILKHFINFKCGTPLMQTLRRIRKEDSEKGLTDDEIKAHCDKVSDAVYYSMHRNDCIHLQMVHMLEDDVNGIMTYEQAEQIATDYFNSFEKTLGRAGRHSISNEDAKQEKRFFEREREFRNQDKGMIVNSIDKLNEILNAFDKS